MRMESTPKKPTLHRRKKKLSRAPAPPQHGSESDGSADSNSASGDSQYVPQSSERHRPVTKKGEWEILSGLKQGQRFEFSPGKFEGYLHKRRKWPLKGWHKRYFVLENSILTYAKNAAELARGKKHGSMDIGLSVISTKASRRRIDIDADASIIHIRCESQENYLQWVEQLKQHRLRKQHQMLYSEHISPEATAASTGPLLSPASPSDDSPTEPVTGVGGLVPSPAPLPSSLAGTLVRSEVGGGGGTLRPWLLDGTSLQSLSAHFAAADSTLTQLANLHLSLQQHQHSQAAEQVTPSSTKTRRKFRLRKHKSQKSNSVSASQDAATGGGGTAPPTTPIAGPDSTPRGLHSTPSLMHQCSLNQPGDRSSSRSEDITRQLYLQQNSMVGGNLVDLRPLSNSNPALSHTSTSPNPAFPQPPSTPQFFPPSAPHSTHSSTNSTHSRPPSCSDAASTQSFSASVALGPASQPTNSTAMLHSSNSSVTNLVGQSLCPPGGSGPPSISLDASHTTLSGGDTSATAGDDFTILARDLLRQLRALYTSLCSEREQLQQAAAAAAVGGHSDTATITALTSHLNAAILQNTELRNRLARIHADSDISTLPPPPTGVPAAEVGHKPLVTSLSYESSSCFSASEYFDAPEGGATAGGGRAHGNASDELNISDSSSDRSTPASVTTSDASDTATDALTEAADTVEERSMCFTGRRTTLPVPQLSKEDFSVFNFLYKNIGKDLSKVSMPITINEPLNMLQRLCEELEYSELLDKAAGLRDASERMVQVAAFAVSAYASSIHRAAHKPFNPLLGETYECIREDKGFKFVAEQVSHHPPVAACHAHGPNFTLWQDVRIKTKFWGKSLEFQPSGTVQLTLNQHNDAYEWNKVTSCVHNLFGGGTRWVDQYGEAVITNAPHHLTCRLTFVKASSWSSKRHEVYGTVTDDQTGAVLHNLFGKWTEALYCGHAPSARVVWRPGSMPENSHLYYGFTRFAIELNELRPEQRTVLPPTDTRFRPDQRLLEEGRIDEAEEMKQFLELQQRERRKQRETDGTPHIPMWFRLEEGSGSAAGEGSWKFNGEYWKKRSDPGFGDMSFEAIFE